MLLNWPDPARSRHAICPLLAPVAPQSGAFGLYEVSAPGAGEAYAGQSAVADEASTAYLNPAGMTRLRGRQLVLGGQYLDLSMEFQSVGRSGVTPAASTSSPQRISSGA